MREHGGIDTMDSEDRLLALKDRLERKVEKLRSNLSQAESDLEHVARSVELLGQNGKRMKRAELGIIAAELADKSIAQALVLIAKSNNNVLKTTPARSLLIEAGLLNPKTASSVLNTTLKRLRYFNWVSRGVYSYTSQVVPLAVAVGDNRPMRDAG